MYTEAVHAVLGYGLQIGSRTADSSTVLPGDA